METYVVDAKLKKLQEKFLEVCKEKGYDPIREMDRAIDYLEVDNPVEVDPNESRYVLKVPLTKYIREMVLNDDHLFDIVYEFTLNIIESMLVYRDGLDLEKNLKRGSHGAALLYLWDDLTTKKIDRSDDIANLEITIPYQMYHKVYESSRGYDFYVQQVTIFILNTIAGNTDWRNRIIKEYISK